MLLLQPGDLDGWMCFHDYCLECLDGVLSVLSVDILAYIEIHT